MEQQSSTSKVTVEYFDPHDVYKLLTPGLIPRLPLHNLHWQSHAGPLRSIDTLHVELVQGDFEASPTASSDAVRQSGSTVRDDGFQTQNIGGPTGSTDQIDTHPAPSRTPGGQRRHQIPGLRRTPYLKVLLVRCDDNDSYKSTVRSEIREWVKTHTPPAISSKKTSNQENHDAFEYLIVHVVIPNTVAATQPRSGGKSESVPEKSSSSRWRPGSTPLMEKLRSDFNASGKNAIDHIAQIRIGINDVPYDMLPRVVPAVPSGYSETEQDAENAWNDLVAKFRSLILSSFDMRVTQYEDDIKEKDAQRALPGWNFCTFFILKEGLARGFENVGLVEDALVGYDELSVGLDMVVHEQAESGSPERHGGALLGYTEELKLATQKALASYSGGDDDEEAVDLQPKETVKDYVDEIPITSTKKAYRDMILANQVSVFDFRCYIFSRQISLLLRLGNASSTREELLAKLREQQESVLHGVAPLARPPPKQTDESENLAMLAEICRRTLQFIPSVSQVMRKDVLSAIGATGADSTLDSGLLETVDNLVASFAFSVAQQILAQTSTKALPIPPSTLAPADDQEPKSSIPEPKTMMHPARSSSLHTRPVSRPPPSPGIFPGPGRRASASEVDNNNTFLKAGLEDLAARRAELYMLSRSILNSLGQKRGWSDGWKEAPMVGEQDAADMEEINLDDDAPAEVPVQTAPVPSGAGIDSSLLRTAVDNMEDFYRLYEILTDKTLRHYIVANHVHAVQASKADMAVLKYHLKEYRAASEYFDVITPFFGSSGWSLLELSMLVMYSQCLVELQVKNQYVSVALKLLTKSCAAEKERLQQKSSVLRTGERKVIPDMSPIKGVVGNLFSLARSLPSKARVPLENFFTDIELLGAPEYHDRRDSCSLSVSLWSLLPEEISLDGIGLRISCVGDGPVKELGFENKGEITLAPGRNRVTVHCKSVVPGKYRVDHLNLTSSNLFLFFERDINRVPLPSTDVFKHPDVTLYQRASALDVSLVATRHTALDKNNSLDLVLSTGWNSLQSCEIRLKPATGGLRLLTTEAKFVDPDMQFTKAPEAGRFFLGSLAAETSATLRFPYSVEQDVGDVAVKVEVSYATESDEGYYLAKSLIISVSLALGVNVQDVFKHQRLFSRFNVSTASSSPLRLYKSELLGSDLFESEFGVPPAGTVLVFPKQPASLLYRVKRKTGGKSGQRSGRIMYLKLHYSVLRTEIEELIGASLSENLEAASLGEYSRVILECVQDELRHGLQAQDLERAALLGEVATSFLDGVHWEQTISGFGRTAGSKEDASVKVAAFLRDWQKSHARIALPSPTSTEPWSILIPVEIPSIAVVHTADMRLQPSIPSLIDAGKGGPTVAINQMLPATLHLKWTRIWDTGSSRKEDQEFSYEVTAPGDTWLLGGRRKGHFVIPGSSSSASITSTPETEAEIPLILIPLREGWLPYPNVEIREIPAHAGAPESPHPCEVDWRNLGETVRVVGQRRAVTVSLDASGPGGGPLVLESESSRC